MAVKLLDLFYEDPLVTCDLDDLERLAKSRYSALKDMEIKLTSMTDKNESMSYVINLLRKYQLSTIDDAGIANDQISHFIMKLFVCKSQDETKWWIDAETLLFKWRCSVYPDFLKMLQAYISFKELKNIPLSQRDLLVHPSLKPESTEKQFNVYYEIPLSIGTSLLYRGYFPIRGKIYCTYKDLQLVAADLFRSGLDLAIQEAQKVEINDERLLRIFGKLKDPDFDFGYKIKPGKSRGISLENLNELAGLHFPPCMKKLHNKLCTEYHLKHYGRLQFGLFLKGIGLTLEESIEFWRKKFTEKMTNEKFIKGYKYNIEHSYGRLGKMADYSPWSCTKITKMAKPAFGEHHGCPFRHSDKAELISILNSYPPLKAEVKTWILERHEREPQVSCIKLFENMRPNSTSVHSQKVGIHPNSFFDASYEYRGK